VGYWAPQPSDVPAPLRNLPDAVLDALALLDVYTGPTERAPQGYLVHTGCVRFSWKPTTVEERLSCLPRPAWCQGRTAYEWLVSAEDCPYGAFLQAHDQYLHARQRLMDQAEIEASAPMPWLPLRFMETVGLEARLLPLHHPADAHAAHVRAYLPDVLQALQCHMDVQMGDGRVFLLQYSSTYTAKFSDQFATEEATDFQLARKVLMEYHPLEPEVWLQLGGQRFRQVLQTGILRRVVLRPLWRGFQPTRWEQLYMASAWRSEDCTLRLCTEAGERRKNRRRVLVAAAMDSAFQESFFGQWLLLNVPFRAMDELWDARVLAVPEGYRMLALCLLKRPGFWRRPHNVQAKLQLEGHRDAHISNVLSMLESRAGVIDAYLVARPFCVLGPAGSGKSTVEVAIRRAAEAGAHVGIACPTGMLASAYRVKFPGLDVDTLRGMFLLHLPQEQTWDCVSSFDMVVVDEVGQLSQQTVERLLWLWDNADRRPALIFLGDFHSFRAWTALARATAPVGSNSSCGICAPCGAASARTCAGSWSSFELRSRIGSSCCAFLRGHRAMADRGPGVSPEPTELDIQDILHETPQTLFLTITRRSAALLNDLVPIYQGMRVTLTRNLQKEQNFVNGMGCTVLGIQRNSVLVRTQCGNVLSVFPYTDDEIFLRGQQRRATYLPLRLGYAVTLMKVQGATLPHITLRLDVPNVEAAAYVALSRVQRDKDWRFLGHLTRHHFTPASGI
ncbi:unnamed protein product, partial [Symbiodinium pilosum]